MSVTARQPNTPNTPSTATTPKRRKAATPAANGNPLHLDGPSVDVHIGDCREVLARLNLTGTVDLVFADPPFNWSRAYDEWDDSMPREDYVKFTQDWLDLCIKALRPGGSIWVNIPDDTAAEIVMHLKNRGLSMMNWCIWHYRFGQNTTSRFINSKVHALYFVKPGSPAAPAEGVAESARPGVAKKNQRTWNADEILEPSDRATTYFDPRTLSKEDGMPAGMRVPMDVWYGQYWGRIQGNNKERLPHHDNQLPEVYLERVIKACSNEGDLVLDPFLGSGTTGVMAHHLKRRFIGTEFSEANANSAFKRIQRGPIVREKSNTGSAIFAPRKAGKKTREKFGLH
jgi:site-specific DNA-methyltransferase (adenine-specific)